MSIFVSKEFSIKYYLYGFFFCFVFFAFALAYLKYGGKCFHSKKRTKLFKKYLIFPDFPIGIRRQVVNQDMFEPHP